MAKYEIKDTYALHEDYARAEFELLTTVQIQKLGEKLVGKITEQGVNTETLGSVRYSFWHMAPLEYANDLVRVEAEVSVYAEVES